MQRCPWARGAGTRESSSPPARVFESICSNGLRAARSIPARMRCRAGFGQGGDSRAGFEHRRHFRADSGHKRDLRATFRHSEHSERPNVARESLQCLNLARQREACPDSARQRAQCPAVARKLTSHRLSSSEAPAPEGCTIQSPAHQALPPIAIVKLIFAIYCNSPYNANCNIWR